jgi:NADH:ubiquinone oxidoreductase subunit H
MVFTDDSFLNPAISLSLSVVLVGLLSQSRYAIIGTIRAIVHTISLDIFVTILYSLLVFSSQSANFHDFINAQNIY